MQQRIQSINDKRGGARKGAGRKKGKDLSKITISVPIEQLTQLYEKGITNRSKAYSMSMSDWLKNNSVTAISDERRYLK